MDSNELRFQANIKIFHTPLKDIPPPLINSGAELENSQRIMMIKGYHNFFNLKAENHTAGERILPLGGEIYLIRSRSFSGSLFVRNCYPDGMRRFENDEAFIMAFLCQSAFVLWKTYEAIINRDSCRQLCRVRLEYLPKEDVWT